MQKLIWPSVLRLSAFMLLASSSLMAQVFAPLTPVSDVLFDGQKINARLALELTSGNSLLGWGDCTAKRNSDGQPYYPAPNERTRMNVQDIPCIYLLVGVPTDFNEYFVTDITCNPEISGRHACMGGYAVDTRIRNRTTQTEDDPDFQIHLNREYYVLAEAAGGRVQDRDLPARRIRENQPIEALRLRTRLAGSTQCKFGFGPLHRRSWCQAYDQSGVAVSEPVTEESYSYVAFSSGSSSCAEVGDYVATSVENDGDAAVGFLTEMGPGIGALIGAGGGQILARKPERGALIGGAFGIALTLPNIAEVQALTYVKKIILSNVAVRICETVGNIGGTSPAPQNPPTIVPGTDGNGRIISTEKMCWQCVLIREVTATVYDNQGNIVEQTVTNVCIKEGFVPCG